MRSLTFKIAGDLRPKQFCHVFGGRSLLTHTRERLDPLFRHDRMLFVVTRAHEAFYREELRGTDLSSILAQPRNRGTGIAIAAALLCLLRRETNPVVAFFPSDHHYSDDAAFASAVGSATACALQNPASVVLLGARARYPEVEYGWIEPEPGNRTAPALRVNRFWEKPSFPEASVLFNGGCPWNTFVMVGQATAFLELISAQVPEVIPSLASAPDGNDLTAVYDLLRPMDFSRDILAPQPQRLLVVCDAGSGWSDLGNPTRVIDALARNSITPSWLAEGA